MIWEFFLFEVLFLVLIFVSVLLLLEKVFGEEAFELLRVLNIHIAKQRKEELLVFCISYFFVTEEIYKYFYS